MFLWLSLIILIVGKIWLLVEAFRQHILWGIGCLLLPVVDLVFLIVHWHRAWRPVLLMLVGYGIGVLAGGSPNLFNW